jgi:hypothetical protein
MKDREEGLFVRNRGDGGTRNTSKPIIYILPLSKEQSNPEKIRGSAYSVQCTN